MSAPWYIVAAWRRSVAGIVVGAAFTAAAGPVAASRQGLGVPVTRHSVVARIVEPASGRIELSDDVQLAGAPAAGEPWRFLLHRGLLVSSVTSGDETLRFEDTARFNPRAFWRRPPYADLAGFDVAREITVAAPRNGWHAAPLVRVTYAGVIADSLHQPAREYGRSFETTSGRIVAEGAFLSAASFWVPWTGADLFAFDLVVECSSAWRAISQGDLVTEVERDALRVTTWRSDRPSPEIYLVAGPYQKAVRDHGSVSLETWCYANTASAVSDPYFEATAAALDRFSATYGAYPFSKFALVENYWQSGYGMPTFTLLGSQVIRLPFIAHTSFPHEILHNWWGNGVYVDAEDGNWCEGLTTFGADYAAKEREGGTAARDYRRDQLIGYRDFALAGGRDFALDRFRERASGATEAVGYGKTLMVFHMLRRSLGQETFDASLRRLFREHQFRFAGWNDVRRAFEQESDRDLADWFDQWIRRPGAPGLALGEVAVDATGPRRRVRGVLVQDAPLFDVDVPVVIAGHGESILREVHLQGARTSFDITVDFIPETVSADPEFQLFRKLHDGEIAPTLSGVLGAERVRVVLGADTAGELREALRSAARSWAAETSVVVIEEDAAMPLADFDGATWFFGEGPAARLFAAGLPALAGSGTIVAAGRWGVPARPAAMLRPAGAEGIAAVARKVPHYSKVSWLVFEGDRNVAKGVWDPGESPLVVRLGAETGVRR